MGSPPTSPFTDLATRSRASTFWSRPQPAASEVLLGNSRISRVAARSASPVRPKRLRWSGFIIFDHIGEFEAAATRLTEFALDGKIVHDEEILPGLEHAPGAIAQLYRGDNHGKLIIAVD